MYKSKHLWQRLCHFLMTIKEIDSPLILQYQFLNRLRWKSSSSSLSRSQRSLEFNAVDFWIQCVSHNVQQECCVDQSILQFVCSASESKQKLIFNSYLKIENFILQRNRKDQSEQLHIKYTTVDSQLFPTNKCSPYRESNTNSRLLLSTYNNFETVRWFAVSQRLLRNSTSCSSF